jgi:DNA invertase Pin-like site-specific DNA recombinase
LIVMRVKAALDLKRGRGEVIGNVPFGYRREGDKLVVDEREQATIARARELAGEGLSLRAIGARLAEEGHRPRKGRRWLAGSVANIVREA